MISKASGSKLHLVIQRGFPIWPNGPFPVTTQHPLQELAIISQQTSWPLPKIQWKTRKIQRLGNLVLGILTILTDDLNICAFWLFWGVNGNTFFVAPLSFCKIATWAAGAGISPTRLKLPICLNDPYMLLARQKCGLDLTCWYAPQEWCRDHPSGAPPNFRDHSKPCSRL